MTEKTGRPEHFRYQAAASKGRPEHAPPDPFALRHPAMPALRRAKIFSPFDALRGFSEAIITAARNSTEDSVEYIRIEPGETESEEVEPGAAAFPEGFRRRCVMCTRFFIDISDSELQDIVSSAKDSILAKRFLHAGSPLSTSGEIRPTDVVAAIATARSGRRTVFPMKWGYHIKGVRDANTVSTILNARIETAAQKRSFRDGWKQHRCIIPASCYFEWEHFMDPAGKQKAGQKYAVQPEGSAITWLCGLYRIEDGLPHFVVLTRPPAEEIAFIHDRMPLIMPRELVDAWIDPGVSADQLIQRAVDHMVYDTAV